MTDSTLSGKAKSGRRGWLIKLAVAAFWLSLWQAAYWAVGQDLLVASPVQVAGRLVRWAGNWDFWRTALYSLGRILAGFGAGVAAGCMLAALCSRLPLARALFSPLLGVVKATPVSSFIILALVWIQGARVPMFISFLMVLPIVWANVSEGIAQLDPRLSQMARLFGLSRGQRLIKVYLPQIMPYLVSAMTVSMGLGWKAGIAAEVLGTPELAIGRELYYAKIYLETADLFAWTAVVVALSMLLERGMVRLIARLGRRFHWVRVTCA
ncbi:MAG: ABC transporter permease [Christensenellales bacterium]|jgi:NitT/TauT family transport system permease protein